MVDNLARSASELERFLAASPNIRQEEFLKTSNQLLSELNAKTGIDDSGILITAGILKPSVSRPYYLPNVRHPYDGISVYDQYSDSQPIMISRDHTGLSGLIAVRSISRFFMRKGTVIGYGLHDGAAKGNLLVVDEQLAPRVLVQRMLTAK